MTQLSNANLDATRAHAIALKPGTGAGKDHGHGHADRIGSINASRRPTSKKFTHGFFCGGPGPHHRDDFSRSST